MTIQQQVCTLEQAKRLSQLGIRQGLSVFFYDTYVDNQRLVMNSTPEDGYLPDPDNTCFSAFTVAELGVMLPENINCFKSNGKFEVSAHKWQYPVKQIQEGFNFFVVKGDTEAECKSAMLITLLKQNLITADEVNARLLTTP
jgi:hypothetical protein